MKKKLLLFVVFIFMLLVLSTHSFAWTLVYSNDSSGNATFGSVSDLTQAVMNGKDIKVIMEEGAFSRVLEPDVVFVSNGKVYLQNNRYVSSYFVGDKMVYQQDPYYVMIILDSSGYRDIIRPSLTSGVDSNHTNDQKAVKWFARW